jgi:hypothetical protein
MSKIKSGSFFVPLLLLTILLGIASGDAPLLQLSDLKYQGAFRLPGGNNLGGPTDVNGFGYGGTSLAYNPARNSLYLVGHDWYQLTAEVSIPQVVNSNNVSALNTAALLQPLTDALEGKSGLINAYHPKIGAQLAYNNQLYVAAWSYYDGSGSQTQSQFVRPLALSATGQVKGPYTVGDHYPGWVDRYATLIPQEWQSVFGGPALTGGCGGSIVSLQSWGPSVSVFNPSDVGVKSPVPATLVVGYPSSNPLHDFSSANPYFNAATSIGGVVFPAGARSVLFFGTHGLGAYCYGPGTSDPNQAGQPADGGVDVWCYDPASGSKGSHNYPYVAYIWAYDANDLLAVKNGQKQPWEIKPYGTWTLDFPDGGTAINGAAYDPATQRIYISEPFGDGDLSLIRVYTVQISGGSPTIPAPPTNFRIR